MSLQYITIKFPTNESGRENVRKRSRKGGNVILQSLVLMAVYLRHAIFFFNLLR